jgi:SWI/SNF-related matrix-associated actin-dependent regulator of chromatin subfamily A3
MQFNISIFAKVNTFSCRIPFVRLDGQMSAKRRQETLERFCRPLDDVTENLVAPGPLSRRARCSKQQGDADDPLVLNDSDSDFVANVDDHGDFLDSEDDDSVRSKLKGKAKAKAKTSPRDLGENPKVMLISLKAGAFGLNLTVANNVYLMDPLSGFASYY